MNVKTVMLGWEFPPFISGGLGTACYGLTKAMGRMGTEIVFLLPRMNPIRISGGAEESVDVLECDLPNVRLRPVSSRLRAYGHYGPGQHGRRLTAKELEKISGGAAPYGPNIQEEVQRYALKVLTATESEPFDIIHAHDWMTFPAGIALAAHTGKPLVVQVHSTEFDRSGEHVNQYVYDIERQGMHAATQVIAVSNYTRNILVNRYAVPPEKIEVVYNGIDFSEPVAIAPPPAAPAQPPQPRPPPASPLQPPRKSPPPTPAQPCSNRNTP